jgi:hypothetical protein
VSQEEGRGLEKETNMSSSDEVVELEAEVALEVADGKK